MYSVCLLTSETVSVKSGDLVLLQYEPDQSGHVGEGAGLDL